MSFGSKFNTGCGCGGNGPSTKKFGLTDCCNVPVQPAPAPCCVSHDIQCIAGVCLNSTCDVVASDEGFFLSFSNVCQRLPIDANNIFFFHPATGLMRVVGFDGLSYKVTLVDPTKSGGLIKKEDCVLIAVVPSSVFTNTTTRCLQGIFETPELDQNATIFIENGAGIPIGATLTFTFNGETGSYLVTAFNGSSNNIYSYEVQNTGSGLTPGIFVNGGCPGECPVPIDIITNVDICDLAETNIADSITACVNGSPRALVPTGEGDIIVGNEELTWELRKITNLDCCVVIDGCLKFSGNTCPDGGDTVVLRDINLDCFEEAWNEVLAASVTPAGGQTNMPMNINGFPVVVTAYNFGTNTATFAPVNNLDVPLLEFPAGTQICLGECCASCLNGPLITNYFAQSPDPELLSVYNFNTSNGALAYDTAVKHYYLIGFAYGGPLTVTVMELFAPYNPPPSGIPRKPEVTDPLCFRNKICNTSDSGCDQMLDLDWNYEMIFFDIPQGVRVHYEVGHFISGAATLGDNFTPNPFMSLSSQSCSAGYVEGPSSFDAQAIVGNTLILFGGAGQPKVLPYICGNFRDYAYLEKCNCGLGIVWFFVSTEVLPGFVLSGNFDTNMNIRQRLMYFNANEVQVPPNDSDAQTWNTP